MASALKVEDWAATIAHLARHNLLSPHLKSDCVALRPGKLVRKLNAHEPPRNLSPDFKDCWGVGLAAHHPC